VTASACEPTARPSAPEREFPRRCSCPNVPGACRELHRRDRVISESRLKRTHSRLAESGERSLRPRGCANSIHTVLRPRVHEDLRRALRHSAARDRSTGACYMSQTIHPRTPRLLHHRTGCASGAS
jgi:hypothetical protein